jgi:hypothetical protein
VVDIGVHNRCPVALDALCEFSQSGSHAPNHLDGTSAILTDFIERMRQVIALARHLEDHPQNAPWSKAREASRSHFASRIRLYPVDGLNSRRRIIVGRRSCVDGDVDQKRVDRGGENEARCADDSDVWNAWG